MSNGTISSVQNVVLGTGKTETSISALVENPPSELLQGKIGESFIMEAIPNPDNFDLNRLQVTLKQSLNGQLLDIPLNIKTSKTLDLANNHNYEIEVRLVSKNPNMAELKILSIDKDRPENFILNASDDVFESVISQKTGGIDTSVLNSLKQQSQINPQKFSFEDVAFNESSAIIETKTSHLSEIKLLPLSMDKALSSIVSKLNLSPSVRQQLLFHLQQIKIDVEIAPLSQQPDFSPQTVQSLEANANSFLEKIYEALKNSLDGAASENLTPETFSRLNTKVLQELQTLQKNALLSQVSLPEDSSWNILQTLLGDFVPEMSLKIPQKTRLLLKIRNIFHEQNAKAPELHSSDMRDILQQLGRQKHNVTAALLQNRIPQNNERMIANILGFIKAANDHNLENWLGEDLMKHLKSLGDEGTDVLEKLNTMLNTQAQENSNWRILNIPFYADNMFNQIRIAIKKMQDENQKRKNENKEKSAVRFVVDTSFTRLGAFQFDGFSFRKDKRFDLILRTEKDLGDDFVSSVVKIFQKTLSDVDYNGNISVNFKEKFIKVCEGQEQTHLENGFFI